MEHTKDPGIDHVGGRYSKATEGSGTDCMDKCYMVGQRIRELREKMGLTQESLAARASLNKSYISLIENGKANLTIQTLNTISNALGIKVHTLFEFEDDHAYTLGYVMTLLNRLPPERLELVGRIIEVINY